MSCQKDDGHLLVHVRIRPLLSPEQNSQRYRRPCIEVVDEKTVAAAVTPQRYEHLSFDAVSPPETDQSTIFDQVAKGICDACLEGNPEFFISKVIMGLFSPMVRLALERPGPCKALQNLRAVKD